MAAIISIASFALLCSCEQKPQAAAAPRVSVAFDNVQIRMVPVAPGIHMLTGMGGNIGVSSGDDGVLIIDDQYAPLTDRIRAAIGEVHPGPIRFVVNTHWHDDHTDGNENLRGIGGVIVAHENVRRRMSASQLNPFFGFKHEAGPQPRMTTPRPAAALPMVTFTEDLSFHWNGDELHVFHVAAAHTDGDAVIHWKKANVFHLGDLYFFGGYPLIDVISGGSVDGVIAALDKILALANDASKIIPGHGPLATKRDLATYRDMLATIRDRVAAAITAGQTLEQVQAARPTREWDAALGGGFVSADKLTEYVYTSLAKR